MNQCAMVYTINEVQQLLNIGRNTAYAFIKEAPFPVIKIGTTYRIPKDGFDRWLQQQ